MASSPGSRTLGSIALPPKALRPCGPPSASAASTSPPLFEPPKPHRNFHGHVNSWRGIAYAWSALLIVAGTHHLLSRTPPVIPGSFWKSIDIRNLAHYIDTLMIYHAVIKPISED